jgi:hypothetical protein
MQRRTSAVLRGVPEGVPTEQVYNALVEECRFWSSNGFDGFALAN